jgi:hypothetical protein
MGASAGGVAGGSSTSEGMSGVGGFLPLASYQAAPRFSLPLGRGMPNARVELGKELRPELAKLGVNCTQSELGVCRAEARAGSELYTEHLGAESKFLRELCTGECAGR